jgi:hypothetical protein
MPITSPARRLPRQNSQGARKYVAAHLGKISGPIEHLSANSDNAVQGTTEEAVPRSVIDHTKEAMSISLLRPAIPAMCSDLPANSCYED